MRIYLIARKGRQAELCRRADELEAAGHEITSAWVRGDDKDDGDCTTAELLDRAAQNLDDIDRCDCCLAFGEPPGSPYDRGGRHVELGYALAQRKRCLVVGYLENVFHRSSLVEFCETFEEARAKLEARR